MFCILVIAHLAVIIKGSIFLRRSICRNSDRAIVANLVGISVFFEIAKFCDPLINSTLWSYFALFNSVVYFATIVGLEERQDGRGVRKTNRIIT